VVDVRMGKHNIGYVGRINGHGPVFLGCFDPAALEQAAVEQNAVMLGTYPVKGAGHLFRRAITGQLHVRSFAQVI
jgi:hypothetical protein